MKEKARISNIKAGVGLRAPHYNAVLTQEPDVGFFEVHSENFFVLGGKAHQTLKRIQEKYPLSFHGVSLSLGSAQEPDKSHLKRLKQLVDEYHPTLVSEHIAWTMTDETHLNDLLPIPYTDEALAILARNVDIVQNELQRKILLENPSSYLTFNVENQMHEGCFMQTLVDQTGCGILLDINNIYVSCQNMDTDAYEHLKKMPLSAVEEVHLAGHSDKELSSGKTLKIDTHSDVVCDDVWQLYDAFLKLKKQAVPTLIEWDSDIPEFDVLLAEAHKATLKLQGLKGIEHAA